MTETKIDSNFVALFHQLMKTSFMVTATPEFGAKPAEANVMKLVAAGAPHLPALFRTRYADHVVERMDSLFTRLHANPFAVETFTGAVYQHADSEIRPPLHRFLAVMSNLYRSFLDRAKRDHLNISLKETLPPLAVYQSDSSNGPFTITCENVAHIIGGNAGVASLPRTCAGHPLLYGSLAHETGGHDVLHSDATLLPQLRSQVYSHFRRSDTRWLGVLWDYWMEEAASDVYGVLNVGPSFGYNLALLLAVFIGQSEEPAAKEPRLRIVSGADESGALDVHPTDILRLSLIRGVVDKLTGLSASTRAAYDERLSRLSQSLALGATSIELAGVTRVTNGRSMNFQHAVRLDLMQEAAREVGAMIATVAFEALGGHSVQDIETWDDADENTAVTIAGRLHSGSSIVGGGDDAQIIAGLTLAALQQPDRYMAVSTLANDALDDSFASDPYWGVAGRDLMVATPKRTLSNPEVQVDPYAERIIDYNPLEEDAAAQLLDAATMVTHHQIAPIPWPQGTEPEIDAAFTFKGSDAELPKADFVIITWTSAEANAMSAVMTPGAWAMPPSKFTGKAWHEYTNQWDAKFRGRYTGRSPASTSHYIGKYIPIQIAGRKVLLFKSNFHLARDDKSIPVKDMFKQVIEQTGAGLIITSGTAGAIGPKLTLGDVIVTDTARFKCDGTFVHAPFNGKSYSSGYTMPENGRLNDVNTKLVLANAGQLIQPRKRPPQVFTAATSSQIGQAPVIVTTDKFEFDDKQDTFHLQKLGAMVEMDDAVLGLACQELGGSAKWLAIRNASDPQMPSASAKESSDIYIKYGYWTSIPSALACWAAVLDR